MADASTANPKEDTVPEGNETGNAEPVGEKEANKTPSPKPDQDPANSTEVAPPLITVTKGNLIKISKKSFISVKLNLTF